VDSSRRWLVLGLMSLASLVIVLDSSILNVAVPVIGRELKASTSQLQWILDAYTLVFAALILTGGALGDRFGRGRMLSLGLTIFAGGSAIAAWSDSAGLLIACRGIMGVGAALISPVALSVIVNVFTDPLERAKAIGIWSAATSIGMALGPVTGGVLLRHFWWGSVFIVNIPFAVIVITLTLALVPVSRDPAATRIDLGGVALSLPALCLLLWITIGAPERGWGSAVTLAGFGGSVALLAVFVWWESRVNAPMFDVHILRKPTFSVATAALGATFFSIGAVLFIVTQYLQSVRGDGALRAGLTLVPLALFVSVGALIGPRVSRWVTKPALIATGLACQAGACIALLSIDVGTGRLVLMLALALFGLGQGMVMAPCFDLVMSSAPRDRAGALSGSSSALRMSALALGVAVCGSILSSAYRSQLRRDGGISALAAVDIDEASRSIGTAVRAAERLGGQRGAQIRAVANESYVHAMAPALIVAATVCVAGGAAAWFLLDRRRPAIVAEAA
jgi:EmrB/QacA subfamily drug resistance transporter